MKEELSILIQAQYPLIYLVTSEEERAEQAIFNISQSFKPQRKVYVWTVTHGIVEYGQPRSVTQHNTVSPEAAIEWIIRHKEASIFILKDLHPFIDAPATTRSLRDAIASFKGSQKNIILMSPMHQIPIELEKEVVVLDFPLPNMPDLNKVLSSYTDRGRSRKLSTEGREKLLRARASNGRRSRYCFIRKETINQAQWYTRVHRRGRDHRRCGWFRGTKKMVKATL